MTELSQKPAEAGAKTSFGTEEEIKILERRLQLLREGLKPLKDEDAAQKESHEGHEILEGASQGETPAAPPPPSPPQLPQEQHYHDAKVSELKSYESDKQLKALVEIAFERSVQDAVDIARRLDDAHLLDAFHDTLIDDEKLHKELVESGKLKEIG